MQALTFEKPGAPFQLTTVDKPCPQKGQVLVKQRYTSINPMDNKIRLTNGFGLPLPGTPGYDVCGTVVELGEGVTKFAVGDEVFGEATKDGGCYAEYTVTYEATLAKRTMPARFAGASTVVFGTAWFTLFVDEDLGGFYPNTKKHQGQTIFVPGGGGGVGHAIVALAKKSGYKVISSASKPESIKIAQDAGADYVIDYSKSDVVEEVLKLTNNQGVDRVVDSTCKNPSFPQSAAVVKKGGKWICLTGKFGDQHKEALAKVEERGATFACSDFGRYWVNPEFRALIPVHIPHMLTSCDKLYAEGVHVQIAKVIPLELAQMIEEVAAVGEGRRTGKVVVEIAGDK